MSDRVILVPRDGARQSIEVEGVTGDRFALLSTTEIARLPAWQDRRRGELGEFFDIRGERSSSLLIDGDAGHVNGVGAAMAAGGIVMTGAAGHGLAAGMSGGRVDVAGDIGDDAGLGMSGGALHVRGSAGARLGAAAPGAPRGMTGGEIVVHGSAGADAAAICRRGLVVVGGDAGGDAARGMIAGSLIVLGSVGAGAGRFNKRGSLIVLGDLAVPATYRYACTYRPPHLRLTLTYLARHYDLPLPPPAVTGRYRRYCGDLIEPGKGEILVLERP